MIDLPDLDLEPIRLCQLLTNLNRQDTIFPAKKHRHLGVAVFFCSGKDQKIGWWIISKAINTFYSRGVKVTLQQQQ